MVQKISSAYQLFSKGLRLELNRLSSFFHYLYLIIESGNRKIRKLTKAYLGSCSTEYIDEVWLFNRWTPCVYKCTIYMVQRHVYIGADVGWNGACISKILY